MCFIPITAARHNIQKLERASVFSLRDGQTLSAADLTHTKCEIRRNVYFLVVVFSSA